jgi:hypothetical protein
MNIELYGDKCQQHTLFYNGFFFIIDLKSIMYHLGLLGTSPTTCLGTCLLWLVHLPAKTCPYGKTPPRLGHLAPASEVAGGHTLPF